MQVELVEKEKQPLSLDFFSKTVLFFEKKLVERGVLKEVTNKKLVIVFLSEEGIKNLNKRFLKKDQPTDILSFTSMEEDCFGELALCKQKIQIQSEEHNLTFEAETAYLIIHGLLHLLDFHHEQGGEEARQMYKIQDEIFEEWQQAAEKSSL